VTITALLAAAPPALADGIIIPEPPPWPEPPPLRETWLTIRYHRVTVTIEDQVAVTRVEQEFLNEHDWEAEGTYVFPLPEGAAVSEFVMWVDGVPVEGEILEADEARAIYEDIVRRRRDPALLEYVGRSAVQASIFPIPPGGSRKVELEYSQVLPVESGLVRYVYPLNTEKFSARPLEEVSVRVEIRSRDAMRAVYSPTHQDRVYIERDGDYRAIVGYEEMDVLPEDDFELVYTVAQEDVGLNLLTYRDAADMPSGEDGFFLLLVAPSVEVDKERVIPRDVIMVLDTSGSMDGEKIEQAKEALAQMGERPTVLIFLTDGQPTEGVTEIEQILANVEAAEALAQMGERPTVLIFLTDGQPTEGVTEIEQILANVEAARRGGRGRQRALVPLRRGRRRQHHPARHAGPAAPRGHRLRAPPRADRRGDLRLLRQHKHPRPGRRRAGLRRRAGRGHLPLPAAGSVRGHAVDPGGPLPELRIAGQQRMRYHDHAHRGGKRRVSEVHL
jgi:Ca-activated chloride channel family protein